MKQIKILSLYLLISLSIHSFEEGKVLPSISLRDGEQKFFQLNKLAGKPMVLMAFNLECKYCDPEIRLLNELKENNSGKIQIFLINSDPISKKSEVLEKLKKLNSNLTILFDKNQDYTEGVSFPYTIITDSNLIIKSVTNGFSEDTQSKITKKIEDVLK